MMTLFPVLIFISVTIGVLGLVFMFAPTRIDKRLQSIATPVNKQDWGEAVVNLIGPFARLSAPSGAWELSPLRVRFINAGVRRADARLIYFGAKTLLPLALAAFAYIALRGLTQTDGLNLLMCLMCAALIGCYLPNLVLFVAIRGRKREIFENFPDAADLMLVCVEAGLGLDAALTKIAEEMRIKSMALAEELHLTNLEMRAGGTREKSLRNLALRTGLDEIRTFATMLTQSDKFGTSIGESLRVFSDDLRHKRQMRAEELAAKIPTKMLIPLVLFIFPSIIMVILGPAAIQIIRTIMPMLNGG
jgi:tight adherence protein C